MERDFHRTTVARLPLAFARASGILRRSVAAAVISAGALTGMAALSAPAAHAATLTVTNLGDASFASCPSGAPAGSLRAEVAAASPGDTINFAPGLNGVIDLQCFLEISKNLTIAGPGATVITVTSATSPFGAQFPMFVIDPSVTASISGLTMANGVDFGPFAFSGDGGAICNSGMLFATGDLFSNNEANGNNQGGAIANEPGCLTSFGFSSPVANVLQDSFIGNFTDFGNGGAILNARGDALNAVNDTFFNNCNQNPDQGGGIFNGGTATLTNLTFSGNEAGTAAGTCGAGAGGSGGAIFNATGATATLQNVVLSALGTGASPNTPDECDNAAGGTLTDGGGNIDDDGTCSLTTAKGSMSSASFAQIALQSPAVNAPGMTETEAIPGTSIAHRFAPGNCPTTDQRGVNRPNPDCDSGAYQIPFIYSPCSATSPPLNLMGSAGPNTLTWSPPQTNPCPPLTYWVYRFTQNTAATTIGSTSATSFVDPNTVPGTTYSYYVEAADQAGVSAPSNTVSVTATSMTTPPPPSGTCSSYPTTAAYVCALYVDLLGRAPDPGGLNIFVGQLASGASPLQVAEDVVNSPEYRADYIENDYEAFLGRSVDPGGLSTWLSAFQVGATDEQIDAAILGSNEFFTDAGGTNSGFIDAVYQDLLGRAPDPSGFSTFSSQLASGVSRTQVALEIDNSTESRTDTVQGFYESLLGRPADPGGLYQWVNLLNSGATDEQVLAAIASSQEFINDALAGI